MNDAELRALVRDAVARHLGGAPAGSARPSLPPAGPNATPAPSVDSGGRHASHAIYITLTNVGDACVIEPAVPCSHCGYCKTHGY